MDLALGAMGSLLPKLGELRSEEYKMEISVKRDVESFSRELASMRAALRRVAEVPRDQLDEEVKLWAGDVRELSYDTEDVVDSLLLRIKGSKTDADMDGFKELVGKMESLFKKGKARRQIATAIKDIKERVQDVAVRHERYKADGCFDNLATSITAVDPLLAALYEDKQRIVGIENARDELIEKLSLGDDVSKQPKILSIVGFVGLGKTTLAKAIYDKIHSDFDCAAFVSVSRNPDLKKIFKDILFDVDKYKYMSLSGVALDERQLIYQLQESLETKRYLILLDDIWDIREWQTIRFALKVRDCGSLVIVTTRNFEVAQKAGEVYNMKPLSQPESHELFVKQLLFGGVEKIPHHMDEVTMSIIEKCDCIPLAIITMASLLVHIPWEKWSLVYNSIGFGQGNDNGDLQHTRRTSLVSYYDIPSDVRNCLLHLSTYPHGYMIRKDTLIWKWIALGFIREKPGVWLFEVGERYFNELINKSLVQPVEIPHSGIIIGCRVNILVLDMICFLSRQENFVTVLDSHKQDTSDQYQVRQLAIQNSVVVEGFVQKNEHMRSFNATKCEFQMMPSLTSFKLLRVLALEDCTSIGGIYHLEHVRELVQLRYLGLLNTPICELPEGIEKLEFLETLDLRQTKIEKLPHGIVLLRRLMCLRTGSRSITVPDGMGNLASLEELQLSDVAGSPNIVKELGKLKRLRDLKVCIRLSNEKVERDLVYSLGDLQKIEILHLDGGLWIDESCWQGYVPSIYLRHVFLGMKFIRLPAWINPVLLPMLSHLSVDVSVVEEEDLFNLGGLPNLLSLSLVGDYVSLPDTMSGDAFPTLKYCYTSGMVRFVKGAAPDLESISFNVRLWDSKDGRFGFDFSSFMDHSQLQEIRIEIFCTKAHVEEVDAEEAALGDVLHQHPNRPTLAIRKWISSVSEQYGSDYDVDGNEYYDDYEIDSDHEYYDVEE